MGLHAREDVRGMIFILNLNPTSLCLQEILFVFNMVSESGLTEGPGFESLLCNLLPIC